MIESPVDDAGERPFFEKRFGFKAPGVSLHAVAAGGGHQVLCADAVLTDTAVHAGLFQRDIFVIIMHNHGQGGGAAFQHLHLHDHRYAYHAFFYRLGDRGLTFHAPAPLIEQQ